MAYHCTLSNIIKPKNGWPSTSIDEFRKTLDKGPIYARFINYNSITEIFEIEISKKGAKQTINKDFEHYRMDRSVEQINDEHVYDAIKMKMLNSTGQNKIYLVHYISPTNFYVRLNEELNSYKSVNNKTLF
ncbi:unnamed protein product [Adineta steineri]|uniref:Uncharacterized protein n=1 Tax=Adineta steineri TaxID=433720 RepID=A0A813SG57_9BILA|nr:unnamed protein product [Adineta steineri]